jgi:hypothetical protein
MTIPESNPYDHGERSASYPAVLLNSLFEGAQELLGEEKFYQILNYQFSQNDENWRGAGQNTGSGVAHNASVKTAGGFLQVLENIYGRPGGQGLALRIGRASLKHALKHIDGAAPLHQAEFHLLPVGRRLEVGLGYLAQYVSRGDSAFSTVTGTEKYWLWQSTNCPDCRERQGFDPCCFAFAGLLQEFMLWAGNGRYYRVVETQCRAAGSPVCEFRIDKKPLD